MYYINIQPNEAGNYGPLYISTTIKQNMYRLPDLYKDLYIESKGFVTFTVNEEGVVSEIETNTEALEAWNELHPVVPPVPSPQDDIDSMLVDHEFRITLLELGLEVTE